MCSGKEEGRGKWRREFANEPILQMKIKTKVFVKSSLDNTLASYRTLLQLTLLLLYLYLVPKAVYSVTPNNSLLPSRAMLFLVHAAFSPFISFFPLDANFCLFAQCNATHPLKSKFSSIFSTRSSPAYPE